MLAARDNRDKWGMADWHLHLSEHYSSLSKGRERETLLALEHGLSTEDFQLLRRCIDREGGDVDPCNRYFLPWIVYATEFGYGYSGDEYWQTFESQTRHWVGADRDWLRDIFKKFAGRYNGAKPSGDWARFFSIISWPITHAILPKDLQRDLAHTLYEMRKRLDPRLINDHSAFGSQIEKWGWGRSSRFRNFVKNHDLVGTIGAALLLRDDAENEIILDSTLQRISSDLQVTQEAREWLRRARHSVKRLRLHGTGGTGAGSPAGSKRPDDDPTDDLGEEIDLDLCPQLHLRQGVEKWELWITIPDLAPIGFRDPQAMRILTESRARVVGSSGRRLARGRLLAGIQIELVEWPQPGASLIELDRRHWLLEHLFASDLVIPQGPRWLFKIQATGDARLMRSRSVRAGESYVLLSEVALPESAMIKKAPLRASRVHAYYLAIPSALTNAHRLELREIGLTEALRVKVEPCGVLPAVWTGDGRAEWVEGSPLCLSVRAETDVRVEVTLDSEFLELELGPNEVGYLTLSDLKPGCYVTDFLVSTKDPPNADRGRLEIFVREPRAVVGHSAFSLRLLAEPASPSKEEVWEGRCGISAVGPTGPARLSLALGRQHASELVCRHRLDLPMNPEHWSEILGRFKSEKEVQDSYDECDWLRIEVDGGLAGIRTLDCYREFVPLRWAVRRTKSRYSLSIIDIAGDAKEIKCWHYSFESPDVPREVDAGKLRDAKPGLYTASTQRGDETGIVIPHRATRLADLHLRPHLRVEASSRSFIARALRSLRLWTNANSPGNSSADLWRRQVLQVLDGALFKTLCGPGWTRFEQVEPWNLTTNGLQAMAAAVSPTKPGLGRGLFRDFTVFLGLPLEDQVHRFCVMTACWADPPVAVHGSDVPKTSALGRKEWLGEFVLRLASDPAGLQEWAGRGLEWGMSEVTRRSEVLRAARFLVAARDAAEFEQHRASFQLHANWRWE
jgi:hypothetical protein